MSALNPFSFRRPDGSTLSNATAWLLCHLTLASMLASVPAHGASGGHFVPHEQVIMKDTLVPGGRVSISQFESSLSVDDALRMIEDDWSSTLLPPMRSHHDGWQVITHLDGSVVESIELHTDGGGLYGRRVRWSVDSHDAASLDADAQWFQRLLPGTARPMPVISHLDGGRRASTLVACADDSVVRLDHWVGHRLLRLGYQMISEGGGESSQSPVVSLYSRDGEEIALSVSREGARQFLVMHWRR
ncbi:MAG: hypothetical protein Q4B13_07910 [Lautropia sp.]|nr:hypothetical protein [Lautropia sp.]